MFQDQAFLGFSLQSFFPSKKRRSSRSLGSLAIRLWPLQLNRNHDLSFRALFLLESWPGCKQGLIVVTVHYSLGVFVISGVFHSPSQLSSSGQLLFCALLQMLDIARHSRVFSDGSFSHL